MTMLLAEDWMLTQVNNLRLDEQQILALKQMCHLSKNMFNVGLYNVRQYFFQERKHLRYERNYYHSKENDNYKLLPTDIAQQTLKIVDRSFKSFFGLLKLKSSGGYQEKIRLPQYLPKDGHFLLVIPIRKRDWEKLPGKDWLFTVPMSCKFKREHGAVQFAVPERLRTKTVKEIRIIPKYGARYFDVCYCYEDESEEQVEQTGEILGIDLGLENFATCVSTTQKSFIIDGKRIKSDNQYNKRNSKLQSIKDLQGIKALTNRQAKLLRKRNHKVRDFTNKAARYVVDWCRNNKISKIVIGYNPDLKQKVNLGKRNNQKFTQIPIYTFKDKLESLCQRYGIEMIEQEESYTSKASSLDKDELPVWNADNPKSYKFSGKRIKRGLYRTSKGWLINADCNGALNIIRKHTSNPNDCIGGFRGCLAQPVRVLCS
ncbi:MAG: IS200/IS605 family element transposase accessory protein TnpB [Moorea sp. SIO4A1]|nr:IS200/IS605 family element transposase accessory protein TnpB [Moorena sp. SIO4A5]NEQ58940.1 IS200/IS605 family element transposase accessory protein TnpB [Moorena sp. SIO4A1]